jgi:SAM-dependent methyltransferase
MGHRSPLALTREELGEVSRLRFGEPGATGPLPTAWRRWNYFVPDVFYEAIVAKLVTRRTRWLDVGCGRELFPANERLAQILAARCQTLVGLDPDGTVEENTLVHEGVKCTLEEFTSEKAFDLVTLRMVAEHIAQPQPALASLARLTKPGGKVVVFTINRWSPISIAAWAVPFKLHHAIKHFLWRTEEKDTFPVVYEMNTRARLRQLFHGCGFREVFFAHLPDCRASFRFRLFHSLELLCWRMLETIGVMYPENCLLGVYDRV